MSAPEYTPADFIPRIEAIGDSPRVSTNGVTTYTRTVKFWIGNHGPFFVTGDSAALDMAAVQQAIDKQERDLKTLLKVRF